MKITKKLFRICLYQTISFYLILLIYLITFIALVVSDLNSWTISDSYSSTTYIFLFFCTPLFIIYIVLLFVSKVIMLKMFDNPAIKFLYLFTYIVFLIKLKKLNLKDEFSYHMKVNLVWLILWIIALVAWYVWLAIFLANAPLWAVIIYSLLFALPPLLTTIIPSVIYFYYEDQYRSRNLK